MDNPFLKRATEYFRDEEAFLAVLSPEPMRYFLQRDRKHAELYEKLVNIRGTPGSGKTTLARIFEYPTVTALLRNSSISTHQALVDTLTQCGAITDGRAAVVGCRLALETDYRDVWEFDYPEHVRLSLTYSLIQARAVLAWLRHLQTTFDLAHIRIETRSDAAAAAEAIGGPTATGLLDRARTIERALYKVIGALVAPPLDEIDPTVTEAYRPFDVIERFIVDVESTPVSLRPLVILDDAHVLAPIQFRGLQRSLIRREIRVARWVLARFDVLHPKEAFEALTEDRPDESPLPGVTASRDYVPIMLQSSGDDRRAQRVAFRRMARDMASRYLKQMPVFSTRNLSGLQDLLSSSVPPLPSSKLDNLAATVASAQTRLRISARRREDLEAAIEAYVPQGMTRVAPEIRLQMLSILMHRLEKRGQIDLFETVLPDPASSLPKVDIGVYDGARIQLLHRIDRPYYVGIDDLCDASTENAEQFLRLAANLVEDAAVNLIRGKSAPLEPSRQHQLLRERAERVIDNWDFPHSQSIRRLVDRLADRCLRKSLEPNAPLDQGANAYGILQEEFEAIPERHPELAQVLQAAIGNNALTVVPRYSCKNKEWCLLELGGMVILRYGLTLKRGGFLEGTALELAMLTPNEDT